MSASIEISSRSVLSSSGMPAISVDPGLPVVLSGPPGPWMHKLCLGFAGIGSTKGLLVDGQNPSRNLPSGRSLVLLKPRFFETSRSLPLQLRRRLKLYGAYDRSALRLQISSLLLDAGISKAVLRSPDCIGAGLLGMLAIAFAEAVHPSSLIVEDPLDGMSVPQAVSAVDKLAALAGSCAVLLVCTDPARFSGKAKEIYLETPGGEA